MKSLIVYIELLRCSRTLLLAIVLLLLINAQITAQTASNSNTSAKPAPTATQTPANQAGQTNRSPASPDSGNNTQSSASASTNPNVASTGSQMEIQINGSTAKGPTAAVLIIAVGIFILAIIAARTVPQVADTLGKKTFSLTAVLILILVIGLGIYFIGRAFGGYQIAKVVLPEGGPTQTEAVPAKPNQTADVKPTDEKKQADGTQGSAEPTPKPTPIPTPFPLSVSEVTVPDGGLEKVAGLGDVVIVRVKNLREELKRQQTVSPEATEPDRVDPRKFVLFLDKVEITKLYPFAVDPDRGELHFQLERNTESRNAWLQFLARPKFWVRGVQASVGPEGKTPLTGEQAFALRLYYPGLLKLAVVLFLLFLVGFLIAAKRTGIIRDSGPPTPVGGPLFRPYSLARTQVAWWFFIILGAFLFIGLVTWDFDTITTSSLVLLGIGTGTALGAAMVDANKRESTNDSLRTLKPQEAKLAARTEELKTKIADVETQLAAGAAGATLAPTVAALRAELAAAEADLEQVRIQLNDAASALEKPVTEGFVRDVLSDLNGVAFHRFQIVVWTIVLGLIFIFSVWNDLTMPQFSDTLLALMGISAGTYIGFKIPERQTKPEDVAASQGGP